MFRDNVRLQLTPLNFSSLPSLALFCALRHALALACLWLERSPPSRWGGLFIAAAALRGSCPAFALKEKEDNEQKTSNREAREKSRDQVQHVMYY
jgi:hypothetical protein